MELSLVTSWVSGGVLLLILCSAVYVYSGASRFRSSRRLLLPPSPPGWPVIGHLHLLKDMPHHALAELARSMRAPLLSVRLGSIPAVVISKPDLARAALTTSDAALSSRPHVLSGEFLSFGSSDVTFAPAGPYHRMARGVVVSELLSARRVATYASARVEELRRLLAHLTKSASPETPVDLSLCLLNMANDVVCRVGFGRRLPHSKDDKLAAVLSEAQGLFAGFAIGEFFPELEPVVSTVTGHRRRLKKCRDDLREIFDEIISRRRIHGDRDQDFIDVLLRVQESSDLQVPLTDHNLMAIVLESAGGGPASRRRQGPRGGVRPWRAALSARCHQGSLPAAPAGAAARPAPVTRAVLAGRLPHPRQDARLHQHLRHGPGPGDLGEPAGVLAGTVRVRDHRRRRRREHRPQGSRLQGAALRWRPERVSGVRVRSAYHTGHLGQLAVSLRLGAAIRRARPGRLPPGELRPRHQEEEPTFGCRHQERGVRIQGRQARPVLNNGD